MKKIVVTGYAGFIGSNLTRMLLSDPKNQILGIDVHTYAARPAYAWEAVREDGSFIDAKVDIRDYHKLAAILEDFGPDEVYHLAAESHVCNSITGPRAFAETNFMGTFNLIEALRKMDFKGRLVHVSTDEAFGELGFDDEEFFEGSPINPRSPYSASKAASDLIVRAYHQTYGLAAMVTRCSNNFGPNQHDEKLIPRTIKKMFARKPMTLHGDGSHVRDWIHVDDHCDGLMVVMEKGKPGEMYCIGSGVELSNKELVYHVAEAVREVMGIGQFEVVFNNDRPTDDRRYAVSNLKMGLLGWLPRRTLESFQECLRQTVRWYDSERA